MKQTNRKQIFIIIGTFLSGAVIGVLLLSGYLYAHKDKLAMLAQPPAVNTNVSEQYVKKATALSPGMTLSGKVLSKESSQFSIEMKVLNPLYAGNSTTTAVTIPFDVQKDEVALFASSGAATTSGAYSDIHAGAYVYVQVLQDKKIVYILPAR